MGDKGQSIDRLTIKQEDIPEDRGVEAAADRGGVSVCVFRRDRAEAELGRRSQQCVCVGSYRG